jgi:hypothetical protein
MAGKSFAAATPALLSQVVCETCMHGLYLRLLRVRSLILGGAWRGQGDGFQFVFPGSVLKPRKQKGGDSVSALVVLRFGVLGDELFVLAHAIDDNTSSPQPPAWSKDKVLKMR